MATFTEDEVKRAVMSCHEGCTSGKIEFLQEAFGIEANCEQTVSVTVTITLDTFNSEGQEIEATDVSSAVESLLDCYLGGNLDCENIDTRVDSAHTV